MKNLTNDNSFTLDNDFDSEAPETNKCLDENFDLDLSENDPDDIWGNDHSHYDYFEAERKFLLKTPEQVRPVADHPKVLVKFGHKEFTWEGHKLKFGEDYPRFHRCNGKGCYACMGEARLIKWQIEFFLDLRTRKIVYLAFEKKSKPGSLAAVLGEAFAGGFPAVVSLQKEGMYNFKCTRTDSSPGLDLGEDVIREFIQLLNAGEIDFETIVPKVSNSGILDAEGVGDYLQAIGIRE